MATAATVRPATAADIPALLGLVEQYWAFEGIEGFDAGRSGRVLASFFADPGLGAAWIAEASTAGEGPRAVGYLLACYVFSLEHGGMTAEIDEFFLVAGASGGGLGRQLLAAAEEAFEQAGCTNASLQLGRGNDEAHAFYARCGYGPRSGYELLDKELAPRGVLRR